LNRVTNITQSGTGVDSKRIDYSYDKASQRVSSSLFGGLNASVLLVTSDYLYDKNGRLTDLTHLNNSGNVIADYD
jgi:hypothetical protein